MLQDKDGIIGKKIVVNLNNIATEPLESELCDMYIDKSVKRDEQDASRRNIIRL